MIYKKEPLIEKRDDCVIYKMVFNSLYELEKYLRDNPGVNTSVFKSQKSEYLPESFAGECLSRAIEYCHGGYRKGFDKFLELKRKLDEVNKEEFHRRKAIPSFVGSRPNVASFVADVPKSMVRLERVKEREFIDIYMNLVYSGETTDEQILNRGILTLNLISVLENSGMGVNLYAFEASHYYNEVFIAEVKLKKAGDITDIAHCYYPLCGKEFIRRVFVRVKESMPFKEKWDIGYGVSLSETAARDLMRIGDKAYYISTPADMGIKGEDIYEDADAFLKKLNLTDKVRVPRYRDYFDRKK